MADQSSSAGVRSHRRAPRPPDPASRRRRRGRAVVGAVVVVGVAVVGAWAVGGVGAESDASTPCPDGDSVLSVTAAPEIATVLREATGDGARGVLPGDASCLRVQVTAGSPADVAAALGGEPVAEAVDVPEPPDVWVPDSSLWLQGLPPERVESTAGSASIATSPVVLAVSRPAAEGLGWPDAPLDLVSGLGSGAPAGRLGLPDPRRSMPARAALLTVDQALSAQPDGARRLSTALRAADTSLTGDSAALLASLEDAVTLAVPVPEQAVFAHNRGGGVPPVVASYPATAGVLDYPFVVLADSAATRAAAEVVRSAVTGPAWTERARAAGFRDPGGAPGEELQEQDGVDAARGVGPAADPAALQEALRRFRVLTMGTRMLAVIDVSGSMAAPVPGVPGQTRMDLASGAAANGLGLYPDDAEIGLWVFSTGLTPTTDHRELVPLGPVGTQADGVPGREKLARALAAVDVVPHGDTGLYDTALEAVRTVRSSWDPERVNSVVLMTDGRNDDANSISLEQLLAQLQAEAGDRPVPVIGIAFGPDSDVDALRLISQATGGTTYEVDDVRRIHEVLADALAQRPCRPSC